MRSSSAIKVEPSPGFQLLWEAHLSAPQANPYQQISLRYSVCFSPDLTNCETTAIDFQALILDACVRTKEKAGFGVNIQHVIGNQYSLGDRAINSA